MRTRIIHAHIGAQSTATTRRRPRPPHPSFHSPEPLPRLPHSPSRRACSTRGDDRAAHCWRLSLFGLSCSLCLSVVLAICPFSTRVAHTCTRGERPLFALSQRPFPAPPQPRRGEPAHHTAAPGAGALTGSCRALASFLKLRLKRRMRHARLASLFRVRGPTVPYPRTSSSARERALLQASLAAGLGHGRLCARVCDAETSSPLAHASADPVRWAGRRWGGEGVPVVFLACSYCSRGTLRSEA
jgi:hypothetical protein